MIAGEDASMTGLSHRETYGTLTPVASYPFMGRSGDPFMPGGSMSRVFLPIFLGAKP